MRPGPSAGPAIGTAFLNPGVRQVFVPPGESQGSSSSNNSIGRSGCHGGKEVEPLAARLRFTPLVGHPAEDIAQGDRADSPLPTNHDNSGMAGRLSDLSVSHARAVRSNGSKVGASRTIPSSSGDEDEFADRRRRHTRSPVLPAGSSSFGEALSRASGGSLDEEISQQFASTEPSYSFMRLASAGATGGSPNASVIGDSRNSTHVGVYPGVERTTAPHGFEGLDLGTPVVVSGSPAEIDVQGGYLNENATPGEGPNLAVRTNLSRSRLRGVEGGRPAE